MEADDSATISSLPFALAFAGNVQRGWWLRIRSDNGHPVYVLQQHQTDKKDDAIQETVASSCNPTFVTVTEYMNLS